MTYDVAADDGCREALERREVLAHKIEIFCGQMQCFKGELSQRRAVQLSHAAQEPGSHRPPTPSDRVLFPVGKRVNWVFQ